MIEVLKEFVRKLVNDKLNVSTGKVTAINGTTCTVERENLPTLLDVRLQAIEGEFDTHVLIVPKIGSKVVCMSVDGEVAETCIVKYTQVESITLFKDSFGGLVKSEIVAKEINTLKKELNDLKTVLSNWVTVPNDGGTALKTLVTTWAGTQLVDAKKTDFENEKVKHGG